MSTHAPAVGDGTSLLATLLGEQQDLGAAETFARAHERGEVDAAAVRYSRLMPAAGPGPGQQYAFEVDLDRCSGCKACVTGCHNRNGLDAGETWRSVGLMLGGDDAQPLLRHVTTACHHCVDPACLNGCPVLAYEKDPDTGIVRHLDDQCIGCQYCVMKCPYGVPQYSEARGIVRKCDMCSDRLAGGEAPACVQSCPSDAIRITVVDTAVAALDWSERFAAVPGAPDSRYTRPTTNYLSSSGAGAEAFERAPVADHAHPSLVAMLVLTQAAIGLFVGAQLLPMSAPGRALATAVSLGAAVAGMVAALFHLGRPQWAFRAVLGLRTSWLSREIVAMSTFVALAAGVGLAQILGVDVGRPLLAIAALAGAGAVYSSAMVYRDTPRPYWARAATPLRFFLSAAASGGLLFLLARAATGADLATTAAIAGATALAKVCFDVRDRYVLAPEESRRLLSGTLSATWQARLACALICAALLILAATTTHPAPVITAACVAWLGAEVVDRHLFFRAAVAPRMP